MKKTLLFLAAAFLTLCANAQQKGEFGVGVNVGVAPVIEKGADLTNFGIGAKLNYCATDDIRFEVNTNYWFKDSNWTVFDVSFNAHYLIPVTNKFYLYPLVGIGYGRPYFNGVEASFLGQKLKTDGIGYDRFLANVGLGGELFVSNDVSVNLEVKYQYMKDFQRFPINLGITYHF